VRPIRPVRPESPLGSKSREPASWDDLMGKPSGDSLDVHEFVSRAVHELKTPLSVIHGYARTLLDTELPESDRRWLLQTIAEQSHKVASMLDALAKPYEKPGPQEPEGGG
jgi:nitrogen-specific signal transduction histidine kinase